MAAETASMGAPGYPLRFDVQYPEHSSRLLIFVKWLLAIPHLLIVYALSAVGGIITFIAFFSILFTKTYPKGLFEFYVNTQRWSMNVSAYAIFLLRDEYPPFSWDPGAYPLTYEVDYPEHLGRWGIFIKWLLIIPNLIALMVVLLIGYLLLMIAWLAILFTGHYPRGIFNFEVGLMRWMARVTAYTALLRDEYPPFSMS